eukprot:862689-Pleurochrysis_carterae.AAC.2
MPWSHELYAERLSGALYWHRYVHPARTVEVRSSRVVQRRRPRRGVADDAILARSGRRSHANYSSWSKSDIPVSQYDESQLLQSASFKMMEILSSSNDARVTHPRSRNVDEPSMRHMVENDFKILDLNFLS